MPTKPAKNSDRPLKPAEEKGVRAAIAEGYKHLKLDPATATSEQVQEALYKEVDRINLARKKMSAQAIEDLAINLGCLWGQTVCDEIGWEWCFATIGDEQVIGIAPPDRSYLIAPMGFVQTQLEKRPPEDNTSRLLFNMVVGGSLKKVKAGSYITVG